MIELGQLERHHAAFAQRGTRVVVVSMESLEDARLTQRDFPHLEVLCDIDRGLSESAALVDAHAAPDGRDVDLPTTILVDGAGDVRWIYRSPAVIARLSPQEALAAIGEHLASKP
jgi:hypothetical protein